MPYVKITDAAALDNIPWKWRNCTANGPYSVELHDRQPTPVVCNRPAGHKGDHMYSTPTRTRGAVWSPDGLQVRPVGVTNLGRYPDLPNLG